MGGPSPALELHLGWQQEPLRFWNQRGDTRGNADQVTAAGGVLSSSRGRGSGRRGENREGGPARVPPVGMRLFDVDGRRGGIGDAGGDPDEVHEARRWQRLLSGR